MENLLRGMEVCKRIQLTKGEKLYAGVDVHKKSYSVALWSTKRNQVGTWNMPSFNQGLVSLLNRFDSQIEKVVYEAGPTGFGLARDLQKAAFTAEVISAYHIPKSRDAKCDRIDCRKLAEFASINQLKAVYIPTEQEDSDREVFRVRDQMTRHQRRVKSQIRSLLLYHSIAAPENLKYWSKAAIQELRGIPLASGIRFKLDLLLDELIHVQKQVLRATKELRRLSETERYQQNFKLLKTAQGVGLITAMGMLLELPNYRLFKNKNQIGKILGLSPQVARTGEECKDLGREEGGKERLRSLLIEAAWRWIRKDFGAHQRFNQYLMNTGGKKKAITAMARKLGTKLWFMLITQQPWRSMEELSAK